MLMVGGIHGCICCNRNAVRKARPALAPARHPARASRARESLSLFPQLLGLASARRRRAKGVKFRKHSEKVPDWYTAARLNEPVYGFKTLVEEGSDRILGVHLMGPPHADEVINLFALAIRHDLTVDDLKSTTFAYPTGASDTGYML